MNEYTSNTTLADAADLLRQAAQDTRPVVLLTHAKPDGDAFGSVVALAAALQQLGGRPFACLVPPVPEPLRQLGGQELITTYEPAATRLPDDPALVVILDTGAASQVGPVVGYVQAHLDRALILDHHLSGDLPAAHRFIDATAAACAEIVADVLESWPLPRPCPPIEEALFTAIASDSGWFRFSNTTPRTLRLAATLKERGVDHAAIYALTEQGERPQKLLLLRRALGSLELLAGGRAAVMTLRQRDFADTGATDAETERIIDVPQQVRDIQVVALVTERTVARGERPVTAVSFRSKPLPSAVNVATLAGRFGGGGHARAAGAKVHAPLDTVLADVKAALGDAMGA